jgi:Ser/Thr protein kinase RdoA (MazF antagonist)
MPSHPPAPPADVIARWRAFAHARISSIQGGLINQTFRVDRADAESAILQRLHPVFSAQLNLDIDAVTRHLQQRGVATPRLIPADNGELWVSAQDGVWRAMSFTPGVAPHYLDSPASAYQAGALVARFHQALADFDYQYQSPRRHVHDTAQHLARLRQALDEHGEHRLYAAVAPLAEQLLAQAPGLIDLSALPLRHAHGDLKISNLMFDAAGRGLCLIDLDTLARMPWPLEMGDALRSWCNPRREDQLPASLDLDLFAAALKGYRATAPDLIEAQEWAALIPGLARICLELSARFLSDALYENYFGWDEARYASRGEQNLARARAMFALYRDVLQKQLEAKRLLPPSR